MTVTEDELISAAIRKKQWFSGIALGYLGMSSAGLLVGGLLYRARPYFGGRRSFVARLLAERADDIVWIYSYRASVILIPLLIPIPLWKEVIVATRQGRRFGLPVRSGDEQRLLELIAARAPGASVGYDEEKASLFRKNRDRRGA